ncbi:MAG TPA: hypothetical protein VJ729_01465 [Nitrososphaeraceae archaeon]|nr:hypothetical protein [Nitrososphaeraceae archaeon]
MMSEIASLPYLVVGLLSGGVSTAVMTLTEIPSWKRWGLPGVFEWHENQIITRRLFKFPNENNNIDFKGIFFFHFMNGILAGIAFPFIVALFFATLIGSFASLLLLGTLYGFVLWIITLVPIHKPITRLSPFNHPLGHVPALASLGGHIVYGVVLGLMIFTLSNYI